MEWSNMVEEKIGKKINQNCFLDAQWKKTTSNEKA